ncbi:MAG TPA: amidohydrolase family protein [Acidobacteriaceae bacterium]
MRSVGIVCFALLICAGAAAQVKDGVKPYVKEDAPVLVLNHVRVIDGTGAAPMEDQRIDIEHGKITRVQSAKLRNAYPPDAKILDLTGKTVMPGLVGMHEHLFYPTPGDGTPGYQQMYSEMADSAPRLYLAGGVTTARTTGSVEPYTDLAIKKAIDAGETPGPKLLVTGPYLEGTPSLGPQLHSLSGPEDATRTVNYWADEGVTNYKAYMHISPEELKAAIDAAHKRGLKVTGHLCSVGFTKAAELGIDDLEHGLVVDTEFAPGRKEGECPSQRGPMQAMAKSLDVDGPQVKAMIQTLVKHHVAVTSTLAIFETFTPNRPPLVREQAAKREMAADAWSDFATTRAEIAERGEASIWPVLLKKEMQFERSFVKAGGLLLAGCDPTGYGGVLPGFGDQRGMELLVEAGFTPMEAIHIATQNGAIYLGQQEQIGSVAAGHDADLVVVDGNPAEKIDDVERVEIVFKGGVGYDPGKLQASVAGMMGIR